MIAIEKKDTYTEYAQYVQGLKEKTSSSRQYTLKSHQGNNEPSPTSEVCPRSITANGRNYTST